MLTSGYDVIQQQIEKQKSRGNFIRLDSIFWRDKDRKIIRLLHDDPATILSHDFVKCADGSEKNFTCRKSLVEVVENGLKIVEQPCPLCLVEVEDEKGRHLLRPRTVAWGVVGVRQLDPASRTRDVIDVLEEIEIPVPGREGETRKVMAPQVGVINQSLSNFWSHFANCMVKYRTTMDRDYEVVRAGGGKGKGAPNYSVLPEDPIEGLRTKEEVQEHYKDSLRGKTPREILADRINFFGSYQYMNKNLDSDIMNRVEWSDIPQEKTESLDNHPGGLDEFGSNKGKSNDEEQTFDKLKDRLTSMASKAKG